MAAQDLEPLQLQLRDTLFPIFNHMRSAGRRGSPKRFLPKTHPLKLFIGSKTADEVGHATQRTLTGYELQKGQQDQPDVEQDRGILDVEQPEPVFPRTNKLVIGEVRFVESIEDVSLVGKHDRSHIRNARTYRE